VTSHSFKEANVAEEVTYRVRLRDPTHVVPVMSLAQDLRTLFSTIIRRSRQEYGQNSKMRIFITHPSLASDIIYYPRYVNKVFPGHILKIIEKHVKSAGGLPADGQLRISVAVCRFVDGAGRRRTNTDTPEGILSSKSMVAITNDDHLCLPRAIVVAKAKLDCELASTEEEKKSAQNYYDKVRKGDRYAQKEAAVQLAKDAEVNFWTCDRQPRQGSVSDIPAFEHFLQVNIVVISATEQNRRVYNGCNTYENTLVLYHSIHRHTQRGHFDVITKLRGFVGKRFYCNNCHKAYQEREKHSCSSHCSVCGQDGCKLTAHPLRCFDCNQICRSQKCFDQHKQAPSSRRKAKNKENINPFLDIEADVVDEEDTDDDDDDDTTDLRLGRRRKRKVQRMKGSFCDKYWKCLDCSMRMKRAAKEHHKCGETFCFKCHKAYIGNYHPCYVRAEKDTSNVKKLLFYDFEAMQEDGVHQPNLVVVQSVCDYCEDEMDVTENSICSFCGSRCSLCGIRNGKTKEFEHAPCAKTCGHRQTVFSGTNTVSDFCFWLFSEANSHAVVIAHNAKGYDNYFIYSHLLKRGHAPPIVFSGTKIMYMRDTQHNITLLDSINFLPMALSKLPKSFGLDELRKGYFPHLFNTKANQTAQLDHLPPMDMYCHNSMQKDTRDAFVSWYEQHKSDPFDLQKDMLSYCISDVDILRRACCKFRNLVRMCTGGQKKTTVHPDTFEEKTGWEGSCVDPFGCVTIASVCMKIFRSQFLPEDYEVLFQADAIKDCSHKGDACTCVWRSGRRDNVYSTIHILHEGMWLAPRFLEPTLGPIVRYKFKSTPIALLPNANVLAHDVYSQAAMQWLKTEEQVRKVKIRSAFSTQGEKVVAITHEGKVHKFKLDGFVDTPTGPIAFEYNGCRFHGCPKCYTIGRLASNRWGKSLEVRYQETLFKERLLKDYGFQVVTMWHCDFQKARALQGEEGIDIGEDLISMKDCYFGGRTNALVLYKKVEPGEKVCYIDFTSLYPSVLKYERYPVGHPTRLMDNFPPLRATSECRSPCQCEGTHWEFPYFGLMKVTVLPPTNLHIPVLPVRITSTKIRDGHKKEETKLKFPLCFTCAKTENTTQECSHTDEERMFTQSYCTPEVEVAINCGYRIVKIHEVLTWSDTEIYNKETKTGGLFTQYINTFLKLKQQASGFPDSVTTPEEKAQYVDNYLAREGVHLDVESIEKNPGLRSLSKLALNSFYGKFGQRSDMGKSVLVNDVAVLYQHMTDPQKKIKDFRVINKDVMLLEYETATHFELDSIAGNVVIAAFCTCYARLKLFRTMHKLGKRVLYHDTDSIIYTQMPGEYSPPLGDYLGDFTDELSCKEVGCSVVDCGGHWIEEFIGCGPKNYSFRLNTGQITCRVRGFSLSYENSLRLNFDSMKEALFAWHRGDEALYETVSNVICRNKTEATLYTEEVKKNYGVVYDKRIVKEDFTTVPYGFRPH